MLKLSACFLFSLFMLMACNNSSNSISNLTTVIATEDKDEGSKAKGLTGKTQEVHMLLNNLKQHFKDESITIKTNEIIGVY